MGDIRSVNTRRFDLDQDLALAGLRNRPGSGDERIRATGFGDLDSGHGLGQAGGHGALFGSEMGLDLTIEAADRVFVEDRRRQRWISPSHV